MTIADLQLREHGQPGEITMLVAPLPHDKSVIAAFHVDPKPLASWFATDGRTIWLGIPVESSVPRNAYSEIAFTSNVGQHDITVMLGDAPPQSYAVTFSLRVEQMELYLEPSP